MSKSVMFNYTFKRNLPKMFCFKILDNKVLIEVVS